MSLPTSPHDVYTRLTEATRSYFGCAASHVSRYDDSGTLERIPQGLGFGETGGELAAGFRLSDGTMLIRQDASALIARFISGEFSSGDPAQRSRELKQLRKVRSALDSLIHENVHALGPGQSGAMTAEWQTARYPHVPVFSEGLAEVAAQQCGGDILRNAGLTDIDPRIAVVASNDEIQFPGAAAAVNEFLQTISSLTGATARDELAMMIRDGGAKQAIDNALRRVMLTQGLGSLTAGPGVLAYMKLSRHVEDAFVSVSSPAVTAVDAALRSRFARSRMSQLRRDLGATVSQFRTTPGGSELAI